MSYQIPRHLRQAIMRYAAEFSEIVDDAVRMSFRTADLTCKRPPGEVDKILSFFIEGLDFIENEFNHLLRQRGIHVTISGIFTHQTPYVSLSTGPLAGKTCELADLCVLVTYGEPLTRDGLGNGCLIQAKNAFPEQSDKVQRELYDSEVQFVYNRPPALSRLNPNRRELPDKWEPALAYWSLGEWPRYEFPPYHSTILYWANHVKRQYPTGHPFGAAIVDLLRGSGGYGFKRPATDEVRWSQMIFDLLSVTARQAVNRDNLNVRDQPRGSDRFARFLLQNPGAARNAYVLRNSLGRILSFYSEELGELGYRLEKDVAQSPLASKLDHYGEVPPNYGDKGPPEPPQLGDERPQSPDDGGAGNIILIHFTREGDVASAAERIKPPEGRKIHI